jgi:DDE_Tnp_1-associated
MEEEEKNTLQSIFEAIEDPRVERTKHHQLIDIIIIAILGVLCGADGWVDIESFGKTKEMWLKTFLDLPNGIPSHDTFGRVFARINPQQFESCFLTWVESINEKINGVIAIDGKTLRRLWTRLKTEDGYVMTIPQKDGTRQLRLFRLKNLRPPSPGKADIDRPPNTLLFTLSRSELIRRLNTRQCEYCETLQGPFEVHHVRKLKDIKQGKTMWQRMMIARQRKTLVLCRFCHHLLHAGTLPDRDHASHRERESRVR